MPWTFPPPFGSFLSSRMNEKSSRQGSAISLSSLGGSISAPVLIDHTLTQRLSELYGVNNVLVSQVPSLCSVQPVLPSDERPGLMPWMKPVTRWLFHELRHRYRQLKALGWLPRALEQRWDLLVVRPTLGHVNIVPRLLCSEIPAVILKNPDRQFVQYCITKGQRQCWRRLREIEMRASIERTIERELARITDSLSRSLHQSPTMTAPSPLVLGCSLE
jgi:hypothetical protein